MLDPEQYQLVDFGQGKKLERFSGVEVLRDCPAAAGLRADDAQSLKSSRHLAFDRDKQQWTGMEHVPTTSVWSLKHGHVELVLKPTPFGHLGVFCEQASNWSWLETLGSGIEGKKAINLFAYTGGTTLKLASLGASVVHVDSARNVVNWARDNARQSGLADRPVRWIVDDAMTFVNREIKRKNRYDIIVADPPAFGHGGKKASWKIERDLQELVFGLAEICQSEPTAVLFTWHSQGVDASQFPTMVENSFGLKQSGVTESGKLDIISLSGRSLNCGHFFRWHSRTCSVRSHQSQQEQESSQ